MIQNAGWEPTTINAAEVHDLQSSGAYSFNTEGAIRFAVGFATEISSEAIPFKSNTLTMSVDGAAAALVPKATDMSIDKRTVLQSGCSSSQFCATRSALSNCGALHELRLPRPHPVPQPSSASISRILQRLLAQQLLPAYPLSQINGPLLPQVQQYTTHRCIW